MNYYAGCDVLRKVQNCSYKTLLKISQNEYKIQLVESS